MRLSVLVLLLALTGCAPGLAGSGRPLAGAFAPPPGLAVDTPSSPALDSVNAVLAEGRFTLVAADGAQVDVRGVHIGAEVTRYLLPRSGARYLPTADLERIVRRPRGGQGATGALAGATMGLMLLSFGLLVEGSSVCSDVSRDCGIWPMLALVVGAGFTITGLVVDGAVGELARPARYETVYQGPVERYLAPPSPNVPQTTHR